MTKTPLFPCQCTIHVDSGNPPDLSGDTNNLALLDARRQWYYKSRSTIGGILAGMVLQGSAMILFPQDATMLLSTMLMRFLSYLFVGNMSLFCLVWKGSSELEIGLILIMVMVSGGILQCTLCASFNEIPGFPWWWMIVCACLMAITKRRTALDTLYPLLRHGIALCASTSIGSLLAVVVLGSNVFFSILKEEAEKPHNSVSDVKVTASAVLVLVCYSELALIAWIQAIISNQEANNSTAPEEEEKMEAGREMVW
jgi:hypothetical protein